MFWRHVEAVERERSRKTLFRRNEENGIDVGKSSEEGNDKLNENDGEKNKVFSVLLNFLIYCFGVLI